MKRLDLVQLTLIITGIISLFFFMGLIPRFMIYFISWFSDGLRGGYYMQAFIENILLLAVYLLYSIFCIKNSKRLAEWISNRASLHADINFALNKKELLFALFLGLGIYGMARELPALLTDVYHIIRESNMRSIEQEYKKSSSERLIIELISFSLFLVLVLYAKTFADFFAARINNTEPADEINPQPE